VKPGRHASFGGALCLAEDRLSPVFRVSRCWYNLALGGSLKVKCKG
jgi:hypothetical protein